MQRETRRAFLRDMGKLTVAGATLGGLGLPRMSGRALASEPAESVQVLLADVSHPWFQIASASSAPVPGWYHSPVVSSDFAFTHVGLHWRGSELCRPELRTSPDAALWSAWRPITLPLNNGRRDARPKAAHSEPCRSTSSACWCGRAPNARRRGPGRRGPPRQKAPSGRAARRRLVRSGCGRRTP